MANPDLTSLIDALGAYVTTASADNKYVERCAREAVTFIGDKFAPALAEDGDVSDDLQEYIDAACERMPRDIFIREVEELGADLFYRRQAQNGIVSVNAMDGVVARVSRDPWGAAEQRLTRWLGLGFA